MAGARWDGQVQVSVPRQNASLPLWLRPVPNLGRKGRQSGNSCSFVAGVCSPGGSACSERGRPGACWEPQPSRGWTAPRPHCAAQPAPSCPPGRSLPVRAHSPLFSQPWPGPQNAHARSCPPGGQGHHPPSIQQGSQSSPAPRALQGPCREAQGEGGEAGDRGGPKPSSQLPFTVPPFEARSMCVGICVHHVSQG